MAKPTVLVTGGAGFIGSHVANELVHAGKTVIILDDLSGGFKRNLPQGCHFVQGSILDVELIDQLFKEHQFDYVFHLAAYAAEGLSHFIRRFNYSNNIIGSINLINASVKYNIKRFVFTSSIAVYGSGQIPFSETDIPQPEDPYGIAKLAVELDLKAAHEQFGLDYTIFRPHNVYGIGQNLSDPYRNVIGIFMRQLLSNQPLTIFGTGEQTRAFTPIKSVSISIAKCITLPNTKNEIYNLGGNATNSINELVEMLFELNGKRGVIQYIEARNEVVHALSSHQKADNDFGKSTYISLHAGLKEVWAWAKKTEIKNPASFNDIEINRGVPKNWE